MNKTPFLLLLAFAFTACQDHNTPNPNIVRLTATLNSAQEVPTNSSTATGAFTGFLNKTTRVLTYVVTYTGLTPTGGHLHKGAPGVNGPIDIHFPSLMSPINGTATLTQSKADSMIAGLYYANLHTAARPGGEIRGDIKVAP